MLKMFDKELMAEKDFKKNKISCLFAATDANFTIGFVETGRPKTLMRRNQLDEKKQKPVELVFKKKRNEDKYCERIIGNDDSFSKYKDEISNYIKQD